MVVQHAYDRCMMRPPCIAGALPHHNIRETFSLSVTCNELLWRAGYSSWFGLQAEERAGVVAIATTEFERTEVSLGTGDMMSIDWERVYRYCTGKCSDWQSMEGQTQLHYCRMHQSPTVRMRQVANYAFKTDSSDNARRPLLQEHFCPVMQTLMSFGMSSHEIPWIWGPRRHLWSCWEGSRTHLVLLVSTRACWEG